MKIKELIEALQTMPEDWEVVHQSSGGIEDDVDVLLQEPAEKKLYLY